MQIHVRTLFGLENPLFDELKSIGLRDLTFEKGGVRGQGDKLDLYRTNLWSRVGIRVLQTLSTFEAPDEKALYQAVSAVDWSEWLKPASTLVVHSYSRDSFTDHTLFLSQLVKDAIVDQMRKKTGERPSVQIRNADLQVRLYLEKGRAELAIDSSGESLNRRGYRMDGGPAPINEVLAAGCIKLSGWNGKDAFFDPMCGSGTLLVEAAWMATNTAPGLKRKFGFEKWPHFDRALFEREKEKARVLQTDLKISVSGADIDPVAVKTAQQTLKRVFLEKAVSVEEADFFGPQKKTREPGFLLWNPPYDERLSLEDSALFFRRVGDQLKRVYGGWKASILTPKEATRHIGLRSFQKHALLNGPIECRLSTFEITASIGERAPLLTTSKWVEHRSAFGNRLKKVIAHRKKWAKREGISCYRVYDRDIPEVPLTIDRYGEDFSLAEWGLPNSLPESEFSAWRATMLEEAASVLDCEPEKLHYRKREKKKGVSQYEKRNDSESFVEVEEGGLKFLVNLEDYLDTGLFLDHRKTREWIRSEAKDKDFLNLFGYTGSFSVYAASGHARRTVTVDKSNTYLQWAEENFIRNKFNPKDHLFVKSDTEFYLEGETALFDLIVLDPPTFSNSKDASDFDVQRDHGRLLSKAFERLKPQGKILFSTCFKKFKMEWAPPSGYELTETTQETVPSDFEAHRPHRTWVLAPAGVAFLHPL